jgi:hypothetical protein
MMIGITIDLFSVPVGVWVCFCRYCFFPLQFWGQGMCFKLHWYTVASLLTNLLVNESTNDHRSMYICTRSRSFLIKDAHSIQESQLMQSSIYVQNLRVLHATSVIRDLYLSSFFFFFQNGFTCCSQGHQQ